MEKLDYFYPWIDINKLEDQLTLCLDKNSSTGEFTFIYTLMMILKQKNINVKLICFNHSYTHYASIFRKNNLDIKRLENEGRCEIIIITLDEIRNGSISKSWSELIEWQSTFLSTYNDATDHNTDDSLCNAILIDDIDILEIIAPNPLLARQFVSRFISRLNKENKYIPIKYVVLFGRHPEDIIPHYYADKASSTSDTSQYYSESLLAAIPLDESCQPILTEYLRYRADITITVSALETGYSSAVHGKICTIRKDQFPKKQTLHYKALDSGILCNLVGDSF